MLTSLVRKQLVIFVIAAVTGMTVLVFNYLQAPTLLGVGRVIVKLQLPGTGGLYRFSNVTYRGVNVGRVTDIEVIGARYVEATLSLDGTAKIPADLVAHVRNMSAVGEQYVDLQPNHGSPPYLTDGAVIPVDRTTLPQQVGPMLNQVSSLLTSIPQERLGTIMDESFEAFNGAGYDFGSLLDSTKTVVKDLHSVADDMAGLATDGRPILDSQAQGGDAIRSWIANLAGVVEEVRRNDSPLRTVLTQTPRAAEEVTELLATVKPTIPVLLANLTTVGQVAVTYNAAIEQILVLLPPYIAAIIGVTPTKNATGISLGDFALTMADPPACTVGFLPPSSWRSPADESVVETPDGLYCKLPQDSPIAVRGARNYPCQEHPGKRAPTVELCNDETGFLPLAQRQHVLGPYPFDPSLIAQGIPPDSRAVGDERSTGPLEGTPPPVAAPNPDIAVAQYDPHTGGYVAGDGRFYVQSDLGASSRPDSWTQLVLPAP
ncbi:MCE family protein [Mycolicibacterium diernhoferi]|uniref:MCE family protein n=1 Tax=Mycolicibacterium diernhoferi TaxID=1801 RepID=A0A1Q4HG99_9MYCO|nr:MlaD family protein [Mycolicibacterium diernhoferi]OJZ66421.1 virulence factor Mce [Mycolicibacterium diernhoferi]OPE56377.1 virulence factor Mce [Mycolicibacterium diernhoferi]PEG56296.1 MCE family protein [Mycolicibacterium diernhoferi]QYL24594.1 MCE family protein [Mycolicibacterium diernhoferi]